MSKFYYTYKITLLKGSLAGHYYFGQHRTNNLNDGYTGSGKIIRNYFKHYEKIEHQTYVKEIIAFYDNDDQLNEAEKQLISDKYKTDELCLNLCEGGGTTSGYVFSEETKLKISKANKNPSIETRKKMSDATKGNKKWLGKHHSEESKKKIGEKSKFRTPWNKGKNVVYSESQINNIKNARKKQLGSHHSEETKKKISEAHKNLFPIHLNNVEKRVKEEYLNYWLDDGWFYGRKGRKK